VSTLFPPFLFSSLFLLEHAYIIAFLLLILHRLTLDGIPPPPRPGHYSAHSFFPCSSQLSALSPPWDEQWQYAFRIFKRFGGSMTVTRVEGSLANYPFPVSTGFPLPLSAFLSHRRNWSSFLLWMTVSESERIRRRHRPVFGERPDPSTFLTALPPLPSILRPHSLCGPPFGWPGYEFSMAGDVNLCMPSPP